VAAPQHAEPRLLRTSHPDETSDDGRFVGEDAHHGMVWLIDTSDRIVGFTKSVTRLNLDERARPFHKMLSAWLEDRGVQFVTFRLITHAGKGHSVSVGNGGAGQSHHRSRACAPAMVTWGMISSGSASSRQVAGHGSGMPPAC